MDTVDEIARGLGHVRRLAPELDELADRTSAPASMFSASIVAFLAPRPELEPAVLTLRHGRTLVGATVLATRDARLGRQIVKAGPPGEPFRLMIADVDWADPMAAALLNGFSGIDRGWRAHLIDLPADDPTVSALLRQAPHARRHSTTATPTIWVGDGAELNTVLSRNVRNARNKALNKIKNDGRHLDLRWSSDPHHIIDQLPEIIDLHIRRNTQLREQALLMLQPDRQTFTTVLREQARAGRVNLLETRIDGQLAAFAACLSSRGRMWVYANYAHPDWLDFSPGTITNAEVVQCAFQREDVEVLDWGSGVQRYKLSGGAVLVPSQEIYAWRHRHKATLWRARNFQVHGSARPLPLDPRR